MLYILGAIAVIAAAIYFFMRREPKPQTAADIARSQSQDPTPETQEQQPFKEETSSLTESEQPVQEETQKEETQEDSQPENSDQSTTNDDDNKNRQIKKLKFFSTFKISTFLTSLFNFRWFI